MNRAEFKAMIVATGKYDLVGEFKPPLAPADHAGRLAEVDASLYQILVRQRRDYGDVVLTKFGTLYVTIEHFDTVDEEVDWEEHGDRDFLPPIPDTQFIDAVRAWYEANKLGTVVKFKVLEADKDLEFAILRVFDVVAGVGTEQRKLVSRTDGIISVADLS